MNEKEIKYMVDQQRSFFDTGATLPVSARLNALKKIRASIKKHEADRAAEAKQKILLALLYFRWVLESKNGDCHLFRLMTIPLDKA